MFAGHPRSTSALPTVPIAGVPALGLLLLLIGLGARLPFPFAGVCSGVGVLASVAGMVIVVWDPDWYPEALVFAADAREDEMRGSAVVEVLPASSAVAVRRVPSRSRADGTRRRAPDLPTMFRPCLRVDTDAGAFVFETSNAGRRAQELAARYARGSARRAPRARSTPRTTGPR